MRRRQGWTMWWDSEDQGGVPLIRETVFTREEVEWIAEMDEKKGRVDRPPSGGGGGGGGATQARRPVCNVIEAFRGLDYPVTGKDLLTFAKTKGIEEVLWGGKTVNVGQVLARYPETVFLGRQDVENVIALALAQPPGDQSQNPNR